MPRAELPLTRNDYGEFYIIKEKKQLPARFILVDKIMEKLLVQIRKIIFEPKTELKLIIVYFINVLT